MSEHELSVGLSDEWYTPPEILKALNIEFDLDVASPSSDHWVPAKRVFTKEDDGLSREWTGVVFMNPPFGGRNGQVPWLNKFISHGNGIAIVAARTSSKWFQDLIPSCDVALFPRGKTKFIRPNGSIGKSPGTGVVLLAMGAYCSKKLLDSGLGDVFINKADTRYEQKKEIKLLRELVTEAIDLMKIQRECIDHLTGKKDSFGSAETFGFGIRVDKIIKKTENIKGEG